MTCCNTAKNQISTKFHYFQLTTGQFPLVETVKVGICLVSRSRRVFEFATNLRQLTNFVEYTTPIKTPKTAKKAHKDPIISLRPLTTNKTQDMQMTSPRCPISPLIGHSTICVSAAIGSLTRFLLSTCIIHDFTLNFDFTTLIIWSRLLSRTSCSRYGSSQDVNVAVRSHPVYLLWGNMASKLWT